MGQQKLILLEKAFMGMLCVVQSTSRSSKASLGNGCGSGYLVFHDSGVERDMAKTLLKRTIRIGVSQVMFLSLYLSTF